MKTKVYDPVPPGKRRIFTPYIIKNGRVIPHPTGGVFVFDVDDDPVNP